MTRKKAKSSEPTQKPKLVFPWAAEDGYFNGDMFEDWLNSNGFDEGNYSRKEI